MTYDLLQFRIHFWICSLLEDEEIRTSLYPVFTQSKQVWSLYPMVIQIGTNAFIP